MSKGKSLVKDVFFMKGTPSLIVNEEEPVKKIIKIFAKKSNFRDIFVVDKEKILKGVITRSDLLNWTRYKLGIGTEKHRPSMDEIQRYVYSTTAKEIMQRHSHNISVTPEDDIVTALDIMVLSDLMDIPVVDEEGKILGDITLSEILLNLL
jgi:CBS domain-containing protein